MGTCLQPADAHLIQHIISLFQACAQFSSGFNLDCGMRIPHYLLTRCTNTLQFGLGAAQ
jgi:hypothetical protein